MGSPASLSLCTARHTSARKAAPTVMLPRTRNVPSLECASAMLRLDRLCEPSEAGELLSAVPMNECSRVIATKQ
jgi:hypothetical protein